MKTQCLQPSQADINKISIYAFFFVYESETNDEEEKSGERTHTTHTHSAYQIVGIVQA